MNDFYLVKRKAKDGAIRLYAVKNAWNKETKKQFKAAQIYIGCKRADGTYRFNDNTAAFIKLLRGTEFERPYDQWEDYINAQREMKAKKTSSHQSEKAQNSEAETEAEATAEAPDPVVGKVATCTDLCAGTSLLLDHVANSLGLTKMLRDVFGEQQADQLLSLAYYCASNPRSPLYGAALWSENQLLPGEIHFSQADISELLHKTTASKTLEFLKRWINHTPREHRLALDITSVSSYAKHNPDVMPGYNRDQESLQQINLLIMVDQRTRLPVWFEQLPGAISDITTIKDTIQILKQIDLNFSRLPHSTDAKYQFPRNTISSRYDFLLFLKAS